MEYYNQKLCATYAECTGGGAPIVKEGTLRSWLTRGTARYARRAKGRGVKALIEVGTLPEEVREALIARYGIPSPGAREESEGMPVVRDVEALQYYSQYRYAGTSGEEQSLPSAQIDAYTLNASVLNRLIGEEKRLRALGNKLNNSRRDINELLGSLSEALRKEYGHTLPTSVRRLRGKLNAYRKEGYAALVSGAMGNGNSVKITEEAGEYIVALKLSKLPVLTHEEILAAYNRKCAETGWKPLTGVRSLRNYLYAPGIKPKWYAGRVGELKAYQEYGYKHKTTMPTRRDSLWYVDGTRLNLYWNKEGKLATTMVVEVIDAYSDCLLGYALSDREDFAAQYRAVRMALQKAGHRPYELVHDNQGGQTSAIATEWLNRIALVHRSTQPNRPQSKTIENLFGRFQQQVLKQVPWFTGANITSKRAENRPDLEWLGANLNLLPRSLAELEEQYAALREEWNRRKHHRTGVARIEMYQTSVNEALQPFTEGDYEDLCLVTRPRSIRFEDTGLTMERDGEEYAYDAYTFTAEGEPTPDYSWRIKNIDKTFVVRYDPEDATRLYLYTETTSGLRFERIVTAKVTVARAIQEQTPGEAGFIRRIERTDRAARYSMEAERRSIIATWQIGKSNLAPDPKGSSAEERRLLEKETARLEREKIARNLRRGIPITPTPYPLEPASAYKAHSLLTWEATEVKVLSGGETALPHEALLETKEEQRKRIRRKY